MRDNCSISLGVRSRAGFAVRSLANHRAGGYSMRGWGYIGVDGYRYLSTCRNTPRMAAQLGTFTINHRLHTPIEDIGTGAHVWRWIIPANAKKNLLKELQYLGYSPLTLFPELDRVADLSKELLP